MNDFSMVMVQSVPHVFMDVNDFDMIYDSEYSYGFVCMYVCMQVCEHDSVLYH